MSGRPIPWRSAIAYWLVNLATRIHPALIAELIGMVERGKARRRDIKES